MPAFENLIGRRFFRLLVVSRSADYISPKGQRGTNWDCVCDCGQQLTVRASQLKADRTRSCGCMQKEAAAEIGRRDYVIRARAKAITTHGRYRIGLGANSQEHPLEYNSWAAMMRRCLDQADPSYPNYGGRGIRICERWSGEGGFVNFLSDMGPKPDGFSLERKNNDDGYSPSNCKWASRMEQNSNRRKARRAETPP